MNNSVTNNSITNHSAADSPAAGSSAEKRTASDYSSAESSRKILQELFALISELDHIRPDDLPNIDLYMDQVTTFMEGQLESTKRYEEDKILTKTMINNYAKNRLLPSPDKKRYSREHLLLLIFIYYFKNILSINDIQTLLTPITDKYFHAEEKDLTYIYEQVFSLEKNQIANLKKDLLRSLRAAEGTFQDADEEDRDYLLRFSFICMLSFDVYLKKMMIEHLIDDLRPNPEDGKKKPATKKGDTKKADSRKK